MHMDLLSRNSGFHIAALWHTGCYTTHQTIKLCIHSDTPWSNVSCPNLIRPWRHKLHEELAEMLMVPISAALPSLSKPATMASRGTPYGQLTEEEKTRARLVDGSAHYAGTTQKWTASALLPLSEAVLKDIGERISSVWSELWAMHLVIYFALEGNWLGVWLYIDSQAVTNGLLNLSGTLKK